MSPADRQQILHDEIMELIQDAQSDLGMDLKGMDIRNLLGPHAFPDYQKWELDQAIEHLMHEGLITADGKIVVR